MAAAGEKPMAVDTRHPPQPYAEARTLLRDLRAGFVASQVAFRGVARDRR